MPRSRPQLSSTQHGWSSISWRDLTASSIESSFYSTWDERCSREWLDPGPPYETRIHLDATLVGIGAVGSTVVHALWTLPGAKGTVTLIDGDKKGVDLTNLNRYPLFGAAD